jgi:hypothetical protein
MDKPDCYIGGVLTAGVAVGGVLFYTLFNEFNKVEITKRMHASGYASRTEISLETRDFDPHTPEKETVLMYGKMPYIIKVDSDKVPRLEPYMLK